MSIISFNYFLPILRYAFVTMAEDSSADAACQELNGAVIDGQEIKVDRARGGGDRRGGGGGGGFRGGRGGGGGFGGGYGGGRDGGYSRGNNNEILNFAFILFQWTLSLRHRFSRYIRILENTIFTR